MELSLPVYVKLQKQSGVLSPVYKIQLLFHPSISMTDESLQRATTKLIQRTKKEFDVFGRGWSHSELADAAHNPDLKTQRLKLEIDLKKRIAKVTYFMVIVNSFDRKFVFCPAIQDVWFEVDPTEHVASRATEVYQQYFRRQIKELGDDAEKPESFSQSGEAWVSTIDVNVRVDQKPKGEAESKMMALWSEEEMDGATELLRVGRCLNSLYPDDLDHAIRRDKIVNHLDCLLTVADHRPLLLIGQRAVGKTAIIHEVVRRRIDKKKNPNGSTGNFWLLSPQRLISGMSYVGQWENRFLAIIREARKRHHVLYFDDLLGLFHAGRTSNSSLSVADLLKNELLKENIRVLAEITPEAYDKLTDRDRLFADLFHVERIESTGDEETLQIAVRSTMDLEQQHQCSVEMSAIPKVIQLQRQYNRTASFPGKAIKFLNELAVKNHRSTVNEQTVMTEFATTTGISHALLDERVSLSRKDVIKELSASLVGQGAAINACADVIGWTKARLNDLHKPLATLLFLGPTGVGKTECAKVLARYMFQSDKRLLRFDLNEFKSAYSAARLVGTIDEPEGLLTSAVRQNPFSIVLFDEIEKAHKDVFDILLQVTGEGRLTDSLGRTSDFTNCVLVMTSNLGVSTQEQSFGFANEQDDKQQHDHRYIRASQKFFRPEFFNRIDKVIPFDPLSQTQIGLIAEKMMSHVVSRDGLLRRRCILQVDQKALSQVSKKGYHPKLGARALKRAIETEFTQPLANRLSSIRNDVPTVIRVQGTEDGNYDIRVNPLENITPVDQNFCHFETERMLQAVQEFLERFRSEHLYKRPDGEITGSGIEKKLLRYLSLSEQFNVVADLVSEVSVSIKEKSVSFSEPMIRTQSVRLKRTHAIASKTSYDSTSAFLKSISSVADIHQYVNDAIDSITVREENRDPQIRRLVTECSLLESMARSEKSEFCFFYRFSSTAVRGKTDMIITLLKAAYQAMFGRILSLDMLGVEMKFSENESVALFQISGDCVSDLIESETGCQLFCADDGKFLMVQTGVIQLDKGRIEKYFAEPNITIPNIVLDNELRSRLDDASDFRVIRMFGNDDRAFDLKSNTTISKLTNAESLRKLILSGLPVPAELMQLKADEVTQ